jgi:HAD superfamily phosphoserine phosphatase-like hydrolase
MNIILADIEGTLTTGSSWRGLRTYFKANISSWQYNRFFIRWIPRYFLVSVGILKREWAIQAWMADEVRLFRNFSPQQFDEMAKWIVANEMWPKRRRKLIAQLEEQHANGAQIAVVSSAYQPIVAAFAQHLDAIPIGSPLIFSEEKLTGIQAPINAYQHKAAAVRGHFGTGPIHAAYGDTASDLAMLELSNEPVAVNPDRELRKIAITRGWKILACEAQS